MKVDAVRGCNREYIEKAVIKKIKGLKSIKQNVMMMESQKRRRIWQKLFHGKDGRHGLQQYHLRSKRRRS